MSEWLDLDGYPTPQALRHIETWPPEKDYIDLMLLVDALWKYKPREERRSIYEQIK